GTSRSLVVVPASGQQGSTIITLTVSDGTSNTQISFHVTGGSAPPTSGRVLRIANAQAARGADVTVPIQLVSLGNENALGFSLAFDPALVGSPRVKASVADAQLNVNTSQAASGRLGIGLALA